jgi:hypothetical protein
MPLSKRTVFLVAVGFVIGFATVKAYLVMAM